VVDAPGRTSSGLSLVISLVPEISPILEVVEDLLLFGADGWREGLDGANLVKHDINQLTALVKTRLRRMQYRPGLLDGFLAKTGLGPVS
jgi:hypothetical protein